MTVELVIVNYRLCCTACLRSMSFGICESLDYIVVESFMKIFITKSKEVASCCMEMFNCPLPSVSVNNIKCKFLQKFLASENIICRHCADCAKYRFNVSCC